MLLNPKLLKQRLRQAKDIPLWATLSVSLYLVVLGDKKMFYVFRIHVFYIVIIDDVFALFCRCDCFVWVDILFAMLMLSH